MPEILFKPKHCTVKESDISLFGAGEYTLEMLDK